MLSGAFSLHLCFECGKKFEEDVAEMCGRGNSPYSHLLLSWGARSSLSTFTASPGPHNSDPFSFRRAVL